MTNHAYPPALEEIIELCEMLSYREKLDILANYSDQSIQQQPRAGEAFDVEDTRKDAECTDTVGIYLRVEHPDDKAHFRVTLGPEVQTLTKAMTSILCKGLDGATLREIEELPADFVPRIVGAELIRARSQTVYYVLTRMKGAVKVYQNRRRMAANQS